MTRSGRLERGLSPVGAGVVSLAIVLVPLAARASPQVAECIRASDDGQDQRDRGHYTRARADFARCSAADCPTLVRHDCAHWLEDLVAQTPTIVPSARDAAGHDVVAARVRIDGTVVAQQIDGRPIDVDPGPHVVAFDGPGGARAEERIVVRAGEKDRLVQVTFAGPAPAAPPAAPAPEASRPVPVLPLVVGAGAVAAFGFGLYFGLTARSDLSAIETKPCAATRTCNPADVDAVRAKLVISDVLIGAAAVGAAAAIAIYVLSPTQAGGKIGLGVAPLAGGGAARLMGAF